MDLLEDVMNSTEGGTACSAPEISNFPNDLFTKDQLQSGWITIHILVTFYLFYALAIVCDDYFVPSVEVMAKALKIPSEIAGCTILGISNSSPELFTNVIATFIAEGDLGISSIVGASVFNLLAVAASIGIISRKKGALIEWWPLTRDSVSYLISVGALVWILSDNLVEWFDGIILLGLYGFYILLIIFNRRVRSFVKNFAFRVRDAVRCISSYKIEKCIPNSTSTSTNSVLSSTEEEPEQPMDIQPIPDDFDNVTMPLCSLPYGESRFVWIQFIVGWPIRLLYKVSIPDCKLPKLRKLYPLTLLMCILYNTILCYLLGWMVTVIGWTFGVPDIVMGLTLFAIGTSIPQAVSSIIVARRGMGTMAMNNAIGSNIFNILICLGFPWLIQTLILAGDASTNDRYIVVNSEALVYTAMALIAATIVLYIIIAANRYVIDFKVGIGSLLAYITIITLASLLELNVFYEVNPPKCKS